MTCSCLTNNVKDMSRSRKPKWHLKLIGKAKFTEKIDARNPIIYDLDAMYWKHILLE